MPVVTVEGQRGTVFGGKVSQMGEGFGLHTGFNVAAFAVKGIELRGIGLGLAGVGSQ